MPWYPEKYTLTAVNYTDKAKEIIEDEVQGLREKNPGMPDKSLRILEVIHRYRGDAGLSNNAVAYLTSAILHVIDEIYTEPGERE